MEAIELLKYSLQKTTPVLLLGAGFSVGATNRNGSPLLIGSSLAMVVRGSPPKTVCIAAAAVRPLYMQTICLPIPYGIEISRNHVYHQLLSNGMYMGQVRIDFTAPFSQFFHRLKLSVVPLRREVSFFI